MRRIGTLILAVLAACDFSLCIGAQVLTFRTKAWLSFAPPPCRMPLGPSQASPKLIPKEWPPHDRPRHTLQRSEARSRGSVASTVGRVQLFDDLERAASKIIAPRKFNIGLMDAGRRTDDKTLKFHL